MFCSRAWQRVGPLARRSFKPPCRAAAPVRHMTSGIPGGSTNMTYFILCGGALTASMVYAYKTIISDTERYEITMARSSSTAKAAAPGAETISVEEAEPAPVEPIAEAAAEPDVKVIAEETAALVSEVVVTEAAAEPAVTEEEAPPAALEAVTEADSVDAGVAATVETPAETPKAESAESMPDLLTAVKILTGSTAEIAAASVGEKSLMKAVQHIEGDGKELHSTVEVLQPEILLEATDLEAEEAAVLVNENELKSVEASAVEEIADAEDAEELIGEETAPAEAEKEDSASSSLEEAAPSVSAMKEMVEADDQAAEELEADIKLALSSTEVTVSPSEEAPPAEEASNPVEAATVTSVEDEEAEASTAEASEAAPTAVVDAIQLAAASTVSHLEAPAHEAKPCHSCHSCHSAPPTAEEVAPPAAVGGELISEGAVDVTHEAKKAASLVEEQTTETLEVVTVQS